VIRGEFDLILRFVVFYASYVMRPVDATVMGSANRPMVSSGIIALNVLGPASLILPGIGIRLPLTHNRVM
jgi:hypothetical protein